MWAESHRGNREHRTEQCRSRCETKPRTYPRRRNFWSSNSAVSNTWFNIAGFLQPDVIVNLLNGNHDGFCDRQSTWGGCRLWWTSTTTFRDAWLQGYVQGVGRTPQSFKEQLYNKALPMTIATNKEIKLQNKPWLTKGIQKSLKQTI